MEKGCCGSLPHHSRKAEKDGQMDKTEIVKLIGAPKKEGSNVVSFRCNARYQNQIQALQKELAPLFGVEADDLPVSTVVKFALESLYVDYFPAKTE